MFGEAYNHVAEAYDDHYTSPQCLQENQELYDMLTEIIGEHDKVLDIGCGTGFLLDIFGVEAPNYLGIDPSEAMLEVFRTKYPEYKVMLGAYEDLELPKADVAVALFSGQYIVDEAKKKLPEQADRYLYIFYKPNHYPTWIYSEDEHNKVLAITDYDELNKLFDWVEWHDYLIAYKK